MKKLTIEEAQSLRQVHISLKLFNDIIQERGYINLKGCNKLEDLIKGCVYDMEYKLLLGAHITQIKKTDKLKKLQYKLLNK